MSLSTKPNEGVSREQHTTATNKSLRTIPVKIGNIVPMEETVIEEFSKSKKQLHSAEWRARSGR